MSSRSDLDGLVCVVTGGDRVGAYADPAMEALGVEPGGWSLDSLREHFREDVAADVSLTRSESHL